MDNKEYARVLEEIAALRQIRGDGAFRVRAYENGARALQNLTESIEEVADPTKIEGIGKSIAREIKALRENGVSPAHEELLQELDPGLLDLMKIQGLGPKRIKLMYDKLGISNLDLLREAAETGRLAELEGLGAKTQENILQELERVEEAGGRTPIPAALRLAETIRGALADRDDVDRAEIAGSIRRGKETIGDIDILIAAEGESGPIFDAFVEMKEVGDVIARGDTKTSARLRTGIQVDVRVVKPGEFGAALHYFTGSKEHNVKLRARAKKMGLRVNEYAVTRLEDGERVAGATEEELFETLGLKWIPPEMREGRDEIELAEKDALPDLIDEAAVRGDIHMHTTETDGNASILEMAEAAKAKGYDYIVITDHSQAVTVANGMTPERFRAHIDAIREANKEIEGFEILSGIEVDILKEGELDMDHDLLAECDWVVGSVHSYFKLESGEMTERLLKGLETGLLSCLGHPTGRILGGRDGYTYDFDAVVEAAIAKRCAFEINGSSGRLDLNADLAAKAKARGAMIVLGSDAHSTRGLDDMRFAVQQARRAWLEKSDVLNTLAPAELTKRVRDI